MKKKTHPHPVDVHVGKRLRLRRTILGLSQEAVARAIGITFQQIQKYERGVNRMSASRLHDFAKTMDVPITFFFEGTPGSGSAQLAPSFGFAEESPAFDDERLSNRETLEIMRNFHRIPDPSVRRKLSETIRAVADALEGSPRPANFPKAGRKENA